MLPRVPQQERNRRTGVGDLLTNWGADPFPPKEVREELKQPPEEVPEERQVERDARRIPDRALELPAMPQSRASRQDSAGTSRMMQVHAEGVSLERALRFMQDRLVAVEAKCESGMDRMEHRANLDMEVLRRLQVSSRELQDETALQKREVGHRMQTVEDLQVRLDRDIATMKEQIRSMQLDFRDFAVQAVQKQRDDLQNMVKDAFQSQRDHEDDLRSLQKKQHQLQTDDIQRVASSVTDIEEQINQVRSEMKSRCAALETSMLGSNGGGGNDPVMNQAVSSMRQHMEMMRQASAHIGAAVQDLQTRVDQEVQHRQAATHESSAKFQEIRDMVKGHGQQISNEFSQRLEILESKAGVDKHDLLARQAQLKEEMKNGEEQAMSEMERAIQQLSANLEAIKKKDDVERETMKQYVQAKLNQFVSSYTSAEESRTSSLTSLYQRVEGFQDKQLDQMKGIRQEIQDSIGDMQQMLRTEVANRTEGQKKLGDSVRETCKFVAAQAARSAEDLQKQIDAVVKACKDQRKDAADRADRLSRYMDESFAKAQQMNGRAFAVVDEQLVQLSQRIGDIHGELKALTPHVDREIDKVRRDTELRQRQSEAALTDQVSTAMKKSELAQKSVDERCTAVQNDLTHRLEMYIGQFDASVASLQVALLGLSKDKSTIGANIVQPLDPGAQREAGPLTGGVVAHNRRSPFDFMKETPFQSVVPSENGDASSQVTSFNARQVFKFSSLLQCSENHDDNGVASSEAQPLESRRQVGDGLEEPPKSPGLDKLAEELKMLEQQLEVSDGSQSLISREFMESGSARGSPPAAVPYGIPDLNATASATMELSSTSDEGLLTTAEVRQVDLADGGLDPQSREHPEVANQEYGSLELSASADIRVSDRSAQALNEDGDGSVAPVASGMTSGEFDDKRVEVGAPIEDAPAQVASVDPSEAVEMTDGMESMDYGDRAFPGADPPNGRGLEDASDSQGTQEAFDAQVLESDLVEGPITRLGLSEAEGSASHPLHVLGNEEPVGPGACSPPRVVAPSEGSQEPSENSAEDGKAVGFNKKKKGFRLWGKKKDGGDS
jgi:predicted  nucleic acid-binding Zn-ribbon protein